MPEGCSISAVKPISPFNWRGEVPPIVLLYTEDHRLTYYSVKCALLSLFIDLDLDFLIAARTAPGHSWINPVERERVIQNVAIAREPTENMEGVLHSCGSMQDIRKATTFEMRMAKVTDGAPKR